MLLEVLSVMMIVGLLSGITIVQVRHWQDKVVLTEVIQDAKNVGNSVEAASSPFDSYQPLSTSGNPVEVAMAGGRIATLTRTNKLTDYQAGDKSFTLSVYNGATPETARAYATYSAEKGGICSSGYGPVKPCGDVLPETVTTPVLTAPVVLPVVPPPAVGPARGTVENPFVAVDQTSPEVRPGDITAAVCPDNNLVNTLNNARATQVNMVFSWTASARADGYDVQLMPLPGNSSTYKLKQSVAGTSATFTMPRQEANQWGSPVGATPAFYGDYSLRIQPKKGDIYGEPYYRVFQFKHYTIQCNAQSVVPESSRVSPLGFIPRESITKTSVRTDAYEDLTFSWGASEGASRYKFTLTSTKDGGKWGTEQWVTGTSASVRLPRTPSDQYGNPIGGADATYYDTYWLRVQPLTSEGAGDARFRMFRYYHYENGTIHAPDGYF